MTPPRIAVVIPTLNESAQIGHTLRALHRLPGPIECVVADGYSTDNTRRIAAPYATVCTSERGRGHQMNAGARHATAPVLLFLHADTQVPLYSWRAMHRALRESDVQAGTFRLAFRQSTPLLRFYAWWTRIDWWGLAFGDRGLFIRRSHFQAVGGFAPLPIFEDLDMARRLCERPGFRFMDTPVVTSARRFRAEGTMRQQVQNMRLWSRYMLGADPHALAGDYVYNSAVREA
ncbi:MAG: TIGR04283 family arsenosugar biosynthesis glycosyltransferase [Longimonas sp.]|uniref:TIGR04283 family arsenosugar biosynthesis glycosyltransferase n=1 Tax=Longimonas sp. TaxID=2039626 RepID=UPI00335A5767